MSILSKRVQVGLDIFEKKWPKELNGARAGLLVHPASTDRNLNHATDIFLKAKKFRLKALFGPQHGILGNTQDNMIEWEGFHDRDRGLPVFSLYGNTRTPLSHMLKDIDVLVIDLQDVGSRYYTYIWTMDLCLRACLEEEKSVVILDRPNPVGGYLMEGPVLESAYASFVGIHPLPIRHGMTMGEVALYLQHRYYPILDLHIIPMKGWRRRMWFRDTGLHWVMPSPNMPTPVSALLYPGMCLLEGTNISEGRGTTRPFEMCGAPFIEPDKLVQHLAKLRLPGVVFRPLWFQPTFQKHDGRLCGGVQLHITARDKFRPFKTGVAIIKTVHDLYPDDFAWKAPPYEYETVKMPIDILAGTSRIRHEIENGVKLNRMEQWWQEQCLLFHRHFRKRTLIYK
jgi:uncharacterized protein YbbC (DUF1343 family)